MTIVRERTHQQLDPVGGLESRPVTLVLLTAIFVGVLLLETPRWGTVHVLHAEILSLAVLGAACLVVAIASAPARAPLNRRVHVVVLALAGVSLVLDTVARWESPTTDLGNPIPLAIGALIAALAPYRPSMELASFGVLTAALVGFVALLRAFGAPDAPPAMVFVMAWVTPVLAVSLAGAAFADSIVVSVERWRDRARDASESAAVEAEEGIARSVQQDRVTILNRDVVPFFVELLERGEVSATDRDHARAISQSIRDIMIADVDRSWLELVVAQLRAAHDGDARDSSALADRAVDDEHRLAQGMATEQRSAMRALLVALFDSPAVDGSSIAISIEPAGELARVALRCSIAPGHGSVRSEISPYIAVIRAAFRDIEVRRSGSRLNIGFCYVR